MLKCITTMRNAEALTKLDRLTSALRLYLQVYVLDGVFVGANDYAFLVKAMLVAAMLGTPLLLAVQPLNWGLVSAVLLLYLTSEV